MVWCRDYPLSRVTASQVDHSAVFYYNNLPLSQPTNNVPCRHWLSVVASLDKLSGDFISESETVYLHPHPSKLQVIKTIICIELKIRSSILRTRLWKIHVKFNVRQGSIFGHQTQLEIITWTPLLFN